MTPATLLAKLLGPRKPATADAIAAEIEARRNALAKAEATVLSAAQARADALANFDSDGMARAEIEGANARRAVEVGTLALDTLKAAHATRVEVDRRAAQDARAAELIAEGDALAADMRRDWNRATAVLADLRHRAALHDLAIENALFAGAIAPDAVPFAEQFRGAIRFGETMPRIVDLSGAPLWPAPLPESDRARAHRESEAEHARVRAEKEAARAERIAEADRLAAEARQAERALEDERERTRFFPVPRALDAAR